MRVDLIVRYDNGTTQAASKSFDDIALACREALDLADRFGRDMTEDSPSPKSIDCYGNGRLEISVSVVRGGLDLKRDRGPR